MSKKLSKMTIKELWHLFPIFLVPHNNNWANWYRDESKSILCILNGIKIISINHIGSTAI